MKKPYTPPRLTELGKIKKCRRCGKYRLIRVRGKVCDACISRKLPSQWHPRRPGRKPNRGKGWRKIVKLNLDHCELCGKSERETAANIHRDHIIPCRFVQLWKLGDPNAEENLICICNSEHAQKKLIEDKIFSGDFLGFVQGLLGFGWPEETLKGAFSFYGLRWPFGGGQSSTPKSTQSSGIPI